MWPIYFDYNATTPLDPMVREAMLPYWGERFGNPSSIHRIGRAARVGLDNARERVAAVFRCKPSEIVFTSGGTESTNLAILGAARSQRDKGRHLVTSSIEHHAVLRVFQHLQNSESFDVTYLPPDSEGQIHLDAVASAIRSDTTLVSIMAANNEIGTLQPVSEIGHLCRSRGVLFHTDAVQWFGKMPFDSIHGFRADLVSFCAHKIHGPKGAGGLFIRSPLRVSPILLGGSHENEVRAGTENLSAIIGLAEAITRFVDPPVFPPAMLSGLTQRLFDGLTPLEGVRVLAPTSPRLPNTLSFTVEHGDSLSLLAALDLRGICASSGAACSAGSLTPSHVLLAMDLPAPLANSFVRFSLGRSSSEYEVSFALSSLPDIIRSLLVSE